MKKLLSIFLFVILIASMSSFQVKASNGVTYKTYTQDSNGELIPSQNAYVSVKAYDTFDGYTLRSPKDIFISEDEDLYIADTENSRVLVVENNLTSTQVIGAGVLKKPTGVFVSSNQEIYVADYEAAAVFKFSRNGELLHTYLKPTEPTYGKETLYRPTKVVLDRGDNLYIISEGTYNGIVQLSQDGTFLGFFGSNISKIDFRVTLYKQIFPDEVVSSFITINPQTMTNLDIDAYDRIATVTKGATGDAIKRLNVAGINQLNTNLLDTTVLNDIVSGPIDNLYTVADDGFIREYDQEGNLLFMFGGKDEYGSYLGLFNRPISVAVDHNYNIYVLDEGKNNIQVFTRTAYAALVHDAVALYQEGKYLESKEPWEKVLKLNAMFDLAQRGIGHAYFKEGMYDEALEAYELSGYKVGYSNAFWEIRNEWLSHYAATIIIVGFSLSIGLWMYKKIKHNSFQEVISIKIRSLEKYQTIKELFMIKMFFKHPVDGYYEIKKHHKASVKSASILYTILFLEYLMYLYMTSSLFSFVNLSQTSIFEEIVKIFGPILLFVICNYLISTITDGEGKITDIFISTIYAMTPLLVFLPIITIVSNVLTLNELFIYQFSMTAVISWTTVLLFIMIKEIHNYSAGKAMKNILLTIITMLIALVSIMLLNNLSIKIIEFIKDVLREAVMR